MLKNIFILVAVTLLAFACKQAPVQPRPTLPLVYSIAADSTGIGALIAQSGRRGGEGSIAIIGDPESAIYLGRLFQGCDRVDNVDGTPGRDSLPDFAGERFDVIMDALSSPYARFWEDARLLPDSLQHTVLDSLREVAVQNAVNAWDTTAWRSVLDVRPVMHKESAKIIILTSSLQARWGLFDVDTLQQLRGGGCPVLSPVHTLLDEAYASGAREIAVWTNREAASAGVWEEAFAEKDWADAHLAVITPTAALDVRNELREVLRQYRETGRALDALLIDKYDVPVVSLESELRLIRQEGLDEDVTFNAMLSPGFTFWEPGSSLIRYTYNLLREHHLFAHHISRPEVNYYESVESREGTPILMETSADYAQRTYVPDLD